MPSLRYNALVLIITIIVSALFTNVSSSSYTKNHTLSSLIRYFEVENEVKNMKKYAQNITFNSTKDKYMFIFYPLMEKCSDSLGDEFSTFYTSFVPGGIGAASYGLVAGAKLALSATLWKAKMAAFLKAATLSTFSLAALPIAAGAGAAAYLYNKYQQQDIKQKCSHALNLIHQLIDKRQLSELVFIKATYYQQLQQKGKKLRHRIYVMTSFHKVYQNYINKVNKLKATQKMILKYMRNFIKFNSIR